MNESVESPNERVESMNARVLIAQLIDDFYDDIDSDDPPVNCDRVGDNCVVVEYESGTRLKVEVTELT